MLVLSRRVDESVVFPGLGITLRIVRAQGRSVQIGIEAPPDVRIARAELVDASQLPAERSERHADRNRLHRIHLSLHLIHKLLEREQSGEAQSALDRLLDWLSSEDRASGHAVRGPIRTLLVDDDTNERELLAGLLGMNGCECASVGDGQDALDYLATHERPDFVLLDMVMPRCDGPQTVARIRSDPRLRDVKLFAISGCNQHDTGLPTGPDGVDAWFRKPLDPRRLWREMTSSMSWN